MQPDSEEQACDVIGSFLECLCMGSRRVFLHCMSPEMAQLGPPGDVRLCTAVEEQADIKRA
jgi:hypothetical protein